MGWADIALEWKSLHITFGNIGAVTIEGLEGG